MAPMRNMGFGGQFRSLGAAVATGERIFFPPDPPVFQLSPWNPITVDFTFVYSTTVTSITPNRIITALNSQLGILSETYPISVRFQTVKIWAGNNGAAAALNSLQTLTLDVNQLSSDNTGVSPLIFSGTDAPAANAWPHVGYRWSLAQQAVAMDNGNTNPAIGISGTPAQTALVRVQLLWRFGTTLPNLRAQRIQFGEPDLSARPSLTGDYPVAIV